jgi:hypothetical protein
MSPVQQFFPFLEEMAYLLELIDGGEILHHAGGCSDNHRCHRLGPAWHIFRRARHQAWVALTSSRHPQPTNTPLQMTKP